MNSSIERFLKVAILTVGLLASTFCASLTWSQTDTPRAVDLNDPRTESDQVVVTNQQSEFDHHSPSFVKSPLDVDPEYEDTEFGELLYNEASVPTRLEVLRLLSKDTPAMLVFLQAISMGLGIDDVLEAAVRYEPDRGRSFAQSAISLLPLLEDSAEYAYGDYELDDLEREDENQPYSVARVAERFFENREVLVPYPDWIEGQSHFYASAVELSELQQEQEDIKWYRDRSDLPENDRPIFVSLYEFDKSILIDGEGRIQRAIEQNGEDARLPVVFIYNRLDERAVDRLEYPKTIRGIQEAYGKESLMVTPAPEWQNGEHHIYGQVREIIELFDLPTEDDFEPEHWQRLLEEAENYKVNNTAFLIVVVSPGDQEDISRSVRANYTYASWDDPRSEADFPYRSPGSGDEEEPEDISLKAILNNGLVLNRPDLIVALDELGVTEVPLAFYYVDQARIKPYRNGPRALRALVEGIHIRPGLPSEGGFGPPPICASPPCNQ